MKAALYLDLDNVLGYCYSLNYQFRISALVSFIEGRGDTLVEIKSFGSIQSVLAHVGTFLTEDEIKLELNKNGVQHQDCTGKKNTTDLALSIDAYAAVDTYEVIYLVSSDTDFSLLQDKLKSANKKIVIVRMFKPAALPENTEEFYYPELLGLKVEDGIDATALVYRNSLEYMMKGPVLDPLTVRRILSATCMQFVTGTTVEILANRVNMSHAYKVIKTAYFGRGFISDAVNKDILLGIRTSPDCDSITSLRSAYYRQCQFLLKRRMQRELDEKALNKLFNLTSERFSILNRRLEKLEPKGDKNEIACA